MKITKQNILQAIKEAKKEEKRRPHHHCDVCFINYLLKIATFNKYEPVGCMIVLDEINKVFGTTYHIYKPFGTTYHIYKPFCEYGKAVSYEPISKRLNRRVIPI